MSKKEISLLAFVVTVVVIIIAIIHGDAEARPRSEFINSRLGPECVPMGQWVYKCTYPDAKCYVVIRGQGIAMECSWVPSE